MRFNIGINLCFYHLNLKCPLAQTTPFLEAHLKSGRKRQFLHAFLVINSQLVTFNHFKIQLFLGSNSTLSQVICGQNVKIGQNVVIRHSVISDNVTIRDNAEIMNKVLFENDVCFYILTYFCFRKRLICIKSLAQSRLPNALNPSHQFPKYCLRLLLAVWVHLTKRFVKVCVIRWLPKTGTK